jgi:hypothetical protein
MAVVWGVLLGGVYAGARRYGRGAWVVGAAVVSHWLLDLPMHRPDLQLWPGSPARVGFGLWNSVAATIALELGLFALGTLVYLRSTRARDRVGSWGLWALLVFLAGGFLSTVNGPPPPSERALAYATLAIWLFVPWAAWVDRHRDPTVPTTRETPARAAGAPVAPEGTVGRA